MVPSPWPQSVLSLPLHASDRADVYVAQPVRHGSVLCNNSLWYIMPTFFDDRRPHNGLTYAEYMEEWTTTAKQPMKGLDKRERKMRYYVRYNLERSQHVHEAFDPSADLREAITSVGVPQLWMVLTEQWCGDSAYNLPVLVEAAALTKDVTLRILPRDANLDIMDQYLTNGSRSIPKLVSFTEEGKELFRWGPRPGGAVRLREEMKASGASSAEMVKGLLDWYANGGWQEVEEELIELLVAARPSVST